MESFEKPSKESLIELGLKFADTNPKLADNYFKQAGLSVEEIQSALLKKESEDNYKKGITRIREEKHKKENKEAVKKIYLDMIEKAEKENDPEAVELYKLALKEIDKQEE